MNAPALTWGVLELQRALDAAEAQPVKLAQTEYDKARAELAAWASSATAELGEKCAACPALRDPTKVKPDGDCQLAVRLRTAALRLADAKAAAFAVSRAMFAVIRAAEEGDSAMATALARHIVGGEWYR